MEPNASNGWITVYNKLQRPQKEAIVAYVKALSWIFLKKHKKTS